jgi:V8-like Glu-specific endopeptidase
MGKPVRVIMKKLTLGLLVFTMLFSFGCATGAGGCISGNCVNGQGAATWSDGEKYVGGFKDGNRNGQGTQTLANGEKYVGEWKDGKFHGHGTQTYPDGRRYVGEFKDNWANGHGTITSADGRKYVGEWKDGNRNGQGTFTASDGEKYVGEWKDGKKHGQGTGTLTDGAKHAKYVGEWRDDKIYGQGTFTASDGEKYVGEFKDFKQHGLGTITYPDGTTWTGEWRDSEKYKEIETADTTPPIKQAIPKSGTGSGFFVSKLGHVITNAHVVKGCNKVTVGDNANQQVAAEIVNTDGSNDLALLKLSSLEMASVESKSLIQKLSIVVVPLASKGLLRSEDVRLGEKVLVAGYPFGDFFSNSIKVTTGVVSSTRGAGDDSGQFQLDAAVQPGNSGGPIYDSGGNIVGVVISQLDKLKVAKAIGSLPENVNFGIKASTVRQFLISSGLPSKKSERTEEKSTEQLAEIAKNQALMVMCVQ